MKQKLRLIVNNVTVINKSKNSMYRNPCLIIFYDADDAES
ncbi:hypothetical protein M917_1272 [Psychrobacter aquaticus CMS 56]|uniref:Uncharacterized protein n=1 Tax=Psychrobacter aquaticus CMS 56 TaxID=1354303 RepID=U4TAT8_9GAMM|nr:hypothetical protein M917_1272 [Psychrobacter aquaticus CMS 56]